MTTLRTKLVTSALLTLGITCSVLMLEPLGVPKLRSGNAAGAATVVPVELVLLVDTSGSVDETEYDLQRQGYEDAFRHPELIQLIERQGGMAVTYIEWSSVDHQDVRIDWTHLRNASDCFAFASAIAGIDRRVEGDTRMAPALQFAANRLALNDYVSLKRVIDVSGDGRGQNYDYYLENTDYSSEHGMPWNDVIAEISGKVDMVNGICITTNEDVIEFYRDVLPQGKGSFMMQVSTFGEFEDAIVQKLIREMTILPGVYD